MFRLALCCIVATSLGCTKPLDKRLVTTSLATRQKALQELESSSAAKKAEIAEAMIKAFEQPIGFHNEGLQHWIQDALARVGKAGVPTLIRALREKDEHIRANVIIALGSIGPDAGEAVPDLIKVYRDMNADRPGFFMRQYAIEALGKIGPATQEVIPVLLGALEDGTGDISDSAGYALVFRSPMVEAAVPVLIRKLKSKDSTSALNTAVFFGPTSKKALPQLTAALKDKNSRVRTWASRALGNMGTEAIDAVPILAQRVITEDVEEVRRSALNSLARLKVNAVAAVPELSHALKSNDPNTRHMAAYALGEIGSSAKPAFTALREALSDSNKEVRWKAAVALEKVGADPDDVLPILIESLKSDDRSSYFSVLLCLGKIGPRAGPAVPHLIRILEDNRIPLPDRQVAIGALARIGPAAKKAAPILLKEADNKQIYIRRAAVSALGAIDLPTEEIVSTLARKLRDKDSGIRVEAARALGNLGPSAANAAPGLANLISRTTHAYEKAAAVEALGKMGPNAKQAVPTLIQSLEQDEFDQIRSTVTIALQKIGTPAGIKAAKEQAGQSRIGTVSFRSIGGLVFWSGVVCLAQPVILLVLWFQRKRYTASMPVAAVLWLSIVPAALAFGLQYTMFFTNWMDDEPGLFIKLFPYLSPVVAFIIGATIVLIVLEGALRLQSEKMIGRMELVRLIAFTLPTTVPVLGWSGMPTPTMLTVIYIGFVVIFMGVSVAAIMKKRTRAEFLSFLGQCGALAGLFLAWRAQAFLF